MVEGKSKGHDRLLKVPETKALASSDAEVIVNPTAEDQQLAEICRTNKSSGSLAELNFRSNGLTRVQIAARMEEQDESISIDYGDGQKASRKSGLTEKDLVNRNGTPYSVYSLEASQAAKKLDPISPALTEGNYQESVKLNVQVTNVPEVSVGVKPEDLLGFTNAVLDAGAKAVRPVEGHLAKPNAINSDLWNLPGGVAKAIWHFSQSPEQLNKDTAVVTNKVIETIDKPMMPQQRAVAAGLLLPIFFFEGGQAPIESKAAQQMKLDQMTAHQLKKLGIERIEMSMPEVPPNLRHLKLTKAEPELIDAMRSKGRELKIIEPGTADRGRLGGLGKEAAVLISTDMPDLLQLKVGAPKIAALEEFLHGTQFRNPYLSELPIAIREIHVKDFMIRHQKMLGLSENDLSVLRVLMQDEIETAYKQGWSWKR